MRRPAIRIILGPLQRHAPKGTFLHGMQKGRTIFIDPRSRDIVNTFVHERLHLENPSASEAWVEKETKRLIGKITWQEAAEILKLIGRAKIGGGD